MDNIHKVHFVGIGGIGMSALARLFLHEGKTVSGSDRSASDITRALSAEGVRICEGHATENIHGGLDLVVYTEAINEKTEGYVELMRARALGIKTLNYFDALGMVANEYYLIAVAGSHGKTTTTAMLIDIFEEGGLDPTAIVGSLRARTKSNYRAGKSKYFIVEACEYKRDFMSLQPDMLIITNIEHEHVDYYANLAEVQSAFRDLARKVPDDGFIICNMKDETVRSCVDGLSATVIDYVSFFNPLRKLSMPGIHNHMNAAAAIAAASLCGIDEPTAEEALSRFSGTWRRFEYKGELNGAKVYDDYGHHPTEIIATLMGAEEMYPGRNIVLVFQSHTYSRTRTLFADFVKALLIPDRVILLPIYAAREHNETGISHIELAEAINAQGGNARTYDVFEDAITELRRTVSPSDMVMVMGAGDVTQIATHLTISI